MSGLGWFVRDQLRRMWQDVVVAYLKHNPHSLVERCRKTINQAIRVASLRARSRHRRSQNTNNRAETISLIKSASRPPISRVAVKHYTLIITPFNALFDAHYKRPADARRKQSSATAVRGSASGQKTYTFLAFLKTELQRTAATDCVLSPWLVQLINKWRVISKFQNLNQLHTETRKHKRLSSWRIRPVI